MHHDYTTPGERGVATRLVRAALNAGLTVSVYDGEEWTVGNSRRERAILAALASTGEDTLRFRRDGENVGSVYLIWGNDPTGGELISDHTDNDAMQALYDAAQPKEQVA
jgi:hypothetical protein